jgi:hypothetical protein
MGSVNKRKLEKRGVASNSATNFIEKLLLELNKTNKNMSFFSFIVQQTWKR